MGGRGRSRGSTHLFEAQLGRVGLAPRGHQHLVQPLQRVRLPVLGLEVQRQRAVLVLHDLLRAAVGVQVQPLGLILLCDELAALLVESPQRLWLQSAQVGG